MLHSLSHRGITRETYLQIDGRTEQEILDELAPEAERALRREAVLTAVVAAEGIEPERGRSARGDHARPPSARARPLRCCSRGCATPGAWRSCARIWRRARRSS